MGVTRRISVHIEELVLDGFPAAQRDRVAGAFRRELTRLLRAPGPSTGVLGSPVDRDHEELPGLAQLPPTASAGQLGTALARAVHDGLTREESG